MKHSLKMALVCALTALSLLSTAAAGATTMAHTPAPPPGSEPRDYAFGATTSQSSTGFGGTADRAVDANTDGRYENKSVSHTTEEFQPWWQADLGTSRKLSSIVVWNRTDCCADRLSGAWVLASDQPITATDVDEARKQPGVSSWHLNTLDGPSARIALKRSARYLRVQLQGTGYLSLAEVQAFGDAVIAPHRTAQRWVKDNPFGMFLHYNMSTYTNEQWADPNAHPAAFNPTGLDPGQWARAMKSAGMTFGVLTAKHHDGFALWPTHYSDHDIAAAPYENGEGDIIRAYVEAMHANHLKVGLYFSIWDRHNGDSLALVKNQLRELLTHYGTIDYLWFDGWGWSVPYSTIPYQPVRDMIREVSPRTVVANNDHLGTLQTTDVIVYEVPVQGMPPADNPRPTDGSDTLDQNRTWFHTTETGTPRPAAEIIDNLRKAKAGNALYLLNVGPDRNGRVPQDYLDRLKEIGTCSDPRARRKDGASVVTRCHGDPRRGPTSKTTDQTGLHRPCDYGGVPATPLRGHRRRATARASRHYSRRSGTASTGRADSYLSSLPRPPSKTKSGLVPSAGVSASEMASVKRSSGNGRPWGMLSTSSATRLRTWDGARSASSGKEVPNQRFSQKPRTVWASWMTERACSGIVSAAGSVCRW